MLGSDLIQELLPDFLDEASTQLNGLLKDLVELESASTNDQDELLTQMLRCLHNLKSVVGFMGYTQMYEICQTMEGTLISIRTRSTVTPMEAIKRSLDCLDRLFNLLNGVSAESALNWSAAL